MRITEMAGGRVMVSRASLRERHTFYTALIGASAGDCWPWDGRFDEDGYGSLTVNSVNRGAHRIAYELAHDAEFAAHFVPADAYERLLAAVGDFVESFDGTDDISASIGELRDAHRAFVEE